MTKEVTFEPVEDQINDRIVVRGKLVSRDPSEFAAHSLEQKLNTPIAPIARPSYD